MTNNGEITQTTPQNGRFLCPSVLRGPYLLYPLPDDHVAPVEFHEARHCMEPLGNAPPEGDVGHNVVAAEGGRRADRPSAYHVGTNKPRSTKAFRARCVCAADVLDVRRREPVVPAGRELPVLRVARLHGAL